MRADRLLPLLLAVGLAACVPAPTTPNLIPIPTQGAATNTPQAVVALPEAGALPTPTPELPTPTPTITPTLPPVLALPDADGVSVVCAENALRVPVAPQDAPISRIETDGERLFLVIDSALYAIPIEQADAGQPQPEPLLTPGEMVGGRPVQEIADLAVREGTLYALDKSTSVYSLVNGTWELLYSGGEVGLAVGPQFMALDVTDDGRVLLLDAANGFLFTPAGLESIDGLAQSSGMTSGHDIAVLGEDIYVMRQDNVILQAEEGVGAAFWQDSTGRDLALAIKSSRHLGADSLITVDGFKREVVTILPDGPTPVTRHAFVFPGMGLLRDATFTGGRLYAVADNDLTIYPKPALSGDPLSGGCPPPGDYTIPELYGVDVMAATAGLAYPIEEGTLPVWPRIYPGAARLYRSGVHRGLDIYQWNAPQGFRTGHPIVAADSGSVSVSTVPYEELTSVVFYGLMDEADTAGYTPEDVLDKLYGRQIRIEHANGIRTVYAHLDAIEGGVVAGSQVGRGELIGTVGVSGSEGEVRPGSVQPHLHFELWIGERYLGYGLTIREAMWWFEQIFEEAR